MPTTSTSVLDAVHIGNGHLPTLPPNLSPQRLRELAAVATYADGPHDGFTVRAPFTDETIATLPMGTPEDIAFAFSRARTAQKAWAKTPYHERAKIFKRYHDLVLERREEALDLIQLESGKTRFDAFQEVGDVAIVSRYYAYHGEASIARSGKPGFVPFLTQVEVNHVPKGVIGIIAPWNYPLTMAISDAIPALLAGNAVVIKPAEQTPFTALWSIELLREAGLPDGLLHMVPGNGATLGPALLANADYLHFTGSTRVGKIVAKQAAERLIGCSLELGGKNPMLVLEDAELDAATEGAIRAVFSSAGQLCISVERLYVHRSIHDAFLAEFARKVDAMRVGAGFGWDMDMGSLASQEQLDKVTEHVDDAIAKGATVVTGGQARPDLGPFFYAPTILAGVTPDMLIYAEETFGPVVSVYSFDTDEEAISLANDSVYGLNASIWTSDVRRGQRLARRIRCGTVGVNDPYTAAWGSTAAPMGGFGESGLGRRHGTEGILKYTEAQTVATQRGMPLAPVADMALETFAEATLGMLKLIRRLPGLR